MVLAAVDKECMESIHLGGCKNDDTLILLFLLHLLTGILYRKVSSHLLNLSKVDQIIKEKNDNFLDL